MDRAEDSRFAQFRQKIRGSEEYMVVGIDVAKDRHHVFCGTATGGTLVKRMVIANDRQGCEWLLQQVDALRVRHHLSKVVFGLEPTGNYHKPLGSFLVARGQLVVLVSGVAVRHNRELLDGRWDKHDTKDAANVADLVAQGKCLFYEDPDIVLRDLRTLLALRRRLVRLEHGHRVRIRNHLVAQYFPELDRYWGSTVTMAVIRWCLHPSVSAAMDYEEFVRRVTTRPVTVRQQRVLRAIWQQAASSIGCAAGDAVASEARVLVEGIGALRETIRAVEAKIHTLCHSSASYPYLISIPGVGPHIAATLIGVIGTPYRFRTAREVLKLAGLDLSAHRSGARSLTATAVISKRGNAALRYALVQAAFIAARTHPVVGRWFTHQLHSRGRHPGSVMKVRVKLAAKLLVIAWTLMKKEEPFNPQYFTLSS
jgi:transposase